ncbi:hypothetical protein MJM45_32815, partial [Salmonella enterica subsp. enterica serovar Kentucky]|nr:hypothetical protein [Salmonella enterica subsp. enterica serovar Kentucky]
HYDEMKDVTIAELFANDSDRFAKFSATFDDLMLVDFSKNRITGNVDIMQGNSRLQADEVQLHQKQAEGQPEPVRTVDALGNVH